MIINVKALKAVNLAASTEQVRYYLNGVYLHLKSDHMIMVATDGKKMLAYRDDYDSPEDAQSAKDFGSVIIPRDLINKIKLAKRGAVDTAEIEITKEKQITIKYCGDIFGAHAVDGTFPAYQRVVPATVDNETAQFDAEYVSDLSKAGQVMGFGKPHIHHNGNGPAIVTFNNDNFLGVLMPIKSVESLPAFNWLRS